MFAHLHLHSQYSLLDGAIRLKDLMPRVLELGMKSVAVTDHGNLFGVVDFYKKAKAAGVKPIIGVETYICADRKDRTHRHNHHLILLAKNEIGYRNLRYLNSMAFMEGFYYHPRIDKTILRERSEGLIGMSACLGGEMAEAYFNRGMEGARTAAKEYASIFAPGDFFLEVQPNGIAKQNEMNDAWRRLAKETGIGLVATGDCHYVRKEDAKAHDVLMAIQTNKDLTNEQRLSHGSTQEYYVKTPAEFAAAFHDMPEALENAAAIASRCNVELTLGKTTLPKFTPPDGKHVNEYFAEIARKGLDSRFAEMYECGIKIDRDLYKQRLEHEIKIISSMDFPGYFLIVWDFIKYAKDNFIPVGPGRGSGAGSLVAYSMRITDLDPIHYGLMFERFLNPERVSMPDFDIDICQRGRGRVIDYVGKRYGRNSVASIITFTTLSAKSGINAVGKVYGMAFDEKQKLTEGLPSGVEGHPPSTEWAKNNSELIKTRYATDPQVREIIDVASSLDGLTKNTGIHAAGVVIAQGDIWDAGVPVIVNKHDGSLVTQFGMNETEAVGLIKFDFLGLKTLSVIDLCIKMIRNRSEQDVPKTYDDRKHPAPGKTFNISRIPLDDPGVFAMIARGDTTGVFQLVENQMRELLRKLKPTRIEDIFAVIALYRPGPIEGGMIPDFIARKHGVKEVVHLHPALAEVLDSTYGVIVYQEQVMKIAQVLAGYSLAQADNLRRVMGKKKREQIIPEKEKFIEGCKKVGICDPVTADKICELIAVFAGYGFNYSHSAAYGLIGYQTAYLKYHYPEEFLAATASCDQDNEKRYLRAIAEVKTAGIRMLPPCVNKSVFDFSVEIQNGEKCIRMSLGCIKDVGDAATNAVLDARKKGPFKSLWDFCGRVDTRTAGKKIIELLIDVGAMDSLGIPSRAAAIRALDSAVSSGAADRKAQAAGQGNLLAMFSAAGAAKVSEQRWPTIPEMPAADRLRREKSALGFYLSGHPLNASRALISKLRITPCVMLEDIEDRTEVRLAGIVTNLEAKPTKSGSGTMARFVLEDADGSADVVVFPGVYKKIGQLLTIAAAENTPMYFLGTLSNDGDEDNIKQKILLREAKKLSEVPITEDKSATVETTEITLIVNIEKGTRGLFEGIYATVSAYPVIPGLPGTAIKFLFRCPGGISVTADTNIRCAPTANMIASLERLTKVEIAKL